MLYVFHTVGDNIILCLMIILVDTQLSQTMEEEEGGGMLLLKFTTFEAASGDQFVHMYILASLTKLMLCIDIFTKEKTIFLYSS